MTIAFEAGRDAFRWLTKLLANAYDVPRPDHYISTDTNIAYDASFETFVRSCHQLEKQIEKAEKHLQPDLYKSAIEMISSLVCLVDTVSPLMPDSQAAALRRNLDAVRPRRSDEEERLISEALERWPKQLESGLSKYKLSEATSHELFSDRGVKISAKALRDRFDKTVVR